MSENRIIEIEGISACDEFEKGVCALALKKGISIVGLSYYLVPKPEDDASIIGAFIGNRYGINNDETESFKIKIRQLMKEFLIQQKLVVDE